MSTPTKADTPRLPEETSTGKGAGSETAKAVAPAQPTQQAAKGGSVSDLDRQIEALRRCEYLKESEVKAICAKAREILVDESNVQRVDAPVTVRFSSSFNFPQDSRMFVSSVCLSLSLSLSLFLFVLVSLAWFVKSGVTSVTQSQKKKEEEQCNQETRTKNHHSHLIRCASSRPRT
jgi:hypothetical protein